MIEIRIHGRGGQGAVVAGKILADAFFFEGKFVQAFPEFGTERRGAPVQSFVRVDEKPIFIKSNVYEPDYVIVLDKSLIFLPAVRYGLKKGALILVNSDTPISLEGFSTAVVDASGIATKYKLGSPTNPIVNTAILGAFVKISAVASIEILQRAIKEFVPVKKEENVSAAYEAWECVKEI